MCQHLVVYIFSEPYYAVSKELVEKKTFRPFNPGALRPGYSKNIYWYVCLMPSVGHPL